jgi:chromosome segregation protein
MRLTSLTIKGFKSFANETTLHFNENVIGIVGPNGSGKSNVVDAIRWVLGEQKNKELRLEKMQDIIFNGTKKKKESNTASVTLTFENSKNILSSEYNSVSVSRVLYRSGESEYRLNDVACRLKDVRSLFLDTGIGPDSYAIIALGMVDDILADKENARRKMFEQAAGISKYKERKKQTLSKLALTNADLDRIEDILYELDSNLKQLEKQAKRTQKYLDLKEKYKELSVQYALIAVSELKNDYKSIDEQHKTQINIYRQNDVKINQSEATLQAEKNKHLDKEIKLSERQKELNALVNQLRDIEEKKSLNTQKLEFRINNKQNLERSIAVLEQSLIKLNEDVKNFESRLANEKSLQSEIQLNLDQSKKDYDDIKLNYQSLKTNYDSVVKIRQEKEQKLFDYEKQVALSNNNIDNLNLEITRITTANTDREQLIKDNNIEIEKINSQIDTKVKEIKYAEEKESVRQKTLEEVEVQISNTRDRLTSLNRTVDAKQNEYDLLKSMINNFEGFPESIKYLSKNWRNDIPLMSDILDVEEQYKNAIEQYLEQMLNYYIVDNISDAKKAIELLIASQNGKANFFILDQIPTDNKQVNESNISGAVKATDIVKVDAKYSSLVAYLLENVFIIDDFEEEIYERNFAKGAIFLSKSGTHSKTKIALSGGSVGLFDGKKIGRKKNFEKLEKIIAAASKDIDELKASLVQLNESKKRIISQAVNVNIRQLVQDRNQLEQNLIKFKTKEESLHELNNRDSQSISKFEDDILILRNSLQILQDNYNTLKAELASKTPDQNVSDDMLQTLSSNMSEASEKYNHQNIASIRQQNMVQNLEKELSYTNARLTEMQVKKDAEIKQIAYLDKELSDLNEYNEELTGQLSQGYEQKKTLESNLNEAEQSFFSARSEISKIEDELKLLTRNQSQLQLRIQDLKEKHTDIKFKISGVSERLKIEFGILINDIINQEPEEGLDHQELEEKVSRMKLKLNNFGEINPLAVQTFNEMKERYDTITKQRDDVIEAKDSLNKTIKEIEDSATKQFLGAFEQIRTHFIDVFRSLFTADDNCDLILLDPENPLESNIDIIAKPKGKRPKSLSQLSGGEKTLTATALLFALYLLKPAPFCIFDEVDAPLDDANIRKFNKIIKKFSKDSQFIIVTHNKSTMAEVDVLYGVYMQDMGVSEVTPVDFRSLQHQDYLESLN